MEKNTKAKRSTFAVLFYLNTSKRRKDGTCPIVGRITVENCCQCRVAAG